MTRWGRHEGQEQLLRELAASGRPTPAPVLHAGGDGQATCRPLLDNRKEVEVKFTE